MTQFKHTRITSTAILLMFFGAVLLSGTSAFARQSTGIIIGTTDFPLSLDPATAVDVPSWELLTHLYTGLTRQVPGTLTYELALAADHTISEDGLTHTYRVREGIAFSDGTPITAETFVTSLNRVLNLGRDGADFVNRYITSVELDSDNVVRFLLVTPLPNLDALVALPPFFPLHPAAYPAGETLTVDGSTQIIGNGVYSLTAFVPQQEYILTPNPAFDGPGALNAQVTVRRYALPIDLRRALQNREVDIAWRALALPDIEQLVSDEDIIIFEQPNLQAYYLLLNHKTIALNNQDSFDDLAVRQAFALLIDRERSAQLGLDATVTPLYSLLPAQFNVPAVTYPGYDVEQADAILEEAGYRPRRRPINTPIFISTDTYGDLMNSAASELRRGIEESDIIDISQIADSQTSTFISAVNRGEYNSAIVGWRPPYASPAAYLSPLLASSSLIPNSAGYGNPDIDDLLTQAAQTSVADEQAACFVDIQEIVLSRVDIIPLWQGKDVIAYWEDVSGIMVESNSWLRFDRLTR